MKQYNKGFTLVEVLIFVTLISLIFITVSYTVTLSLKNTKINEHKILATHYAEELKEWLRGEKEVDWLSFTDSISQGTTYCVNSIPDDVSNLTSGICPPESFLDGIFKRELTINEETANQVKFKVEVKWEEGPNNYLVPISTVFSLWE